MNEFTIKRASYILEGKTFDWLHACRPGSGRDRLIPLLGSGLRNGESMSMDDNCPTCGGGLRTVEAQGASGRTILVRCSECAPNDALGG
jgi:hypothetical protein